MQSRYQDQYSTTIQKQPDDVLKDTTPAWATVPVEKLGRPVKVYQELVLKRGMLHKKKIKYFNPGSQPIILKLESETPIIKVINPTIQIRPGESQYIYLAIRAPSTPCVFEAKVGIYLKNDAIPDEILLFDINVLSDEK